MILARRCRPSLAAAALLTALALGGCGYSPERSLSVASNEPAAATPQAPAQKSNQKAKSAGNRTKPETAKTASASRRTVTGQRTADEASSAAPRRQLAASNSERECLVRAMYFESQRASRDGLMAVGTVVMNRVNSPSYPGTICGVVGQRNQFAPGVLSRSLSPRDRHHAEAAANEILAGKRHEGIGDAMFFHVATRRYKYPNMRYLQVAGGNIFYRKVGRNAPRVVEGSALAYANTAPVLPATPAAPAATETPVTIAAATPAKPAETAISAALAPVQPAPAKPAPVAATPALALVPTPPPRTALALPAPATTAPATTATTAQPAARTVSYTLPMPIGTTLSTPPSFTLEPPTRLSYSAAKPAAADR